jgi:sialate O-acetylesterase
VLYNGMIAPLAPFALRGVVWNQGQGNASHPEQYRALLGALIGDWRRAWQADDLPFLVVQISSWSPPPSWVPNGFASIREAQLQTSETVPHTGLVVTVDLGEQHNPHYKNKQVAGARIALAARGLVYGEPLAYSGPIYDHMQKSGNAIRIFFKPPDDGLKTLDGADLKTFVIAGADQKFVPAQAVIDGSTVVVSAPGVADPAAVRYAWADYVGGCNLCNEDFLPASPFRTDDWPVHVGK